MKLKSKLSVSIYSFVGIAISIASLCGFKCPAQGCPACKMCGK